ncbi:MAG: tetratricopeptide (TPR) repeat protein [Polyangiales bacterium]|jgi:tetratricopeptide (TPR) repeat protein
MQRLFLGLLVGCWVLGAAAPGLAQTRRERREARAAYGQGQAHIESEDFAEAETAFRAAFAIIPNPIVLLGVAGALEGQGKISETVATLEQYLELNPEASDRAQVEARTAALRATPGHLTISSTPAGASISLDGQDTGEITPAEFDLPPGTHVIVIRADGREPAESTIELGFASQEEVAVELAEATSPESIVVDDEPVELDEEEDSEEEESADDGPGTAVWVTSGLAAAGLVGGTVLGFLALSEESSFDDEPSESSADRGERYAIFADVAFGIAAVSAITAVVLLLTKGDDDEDEDAEAASASLSPMVSPFGAGVAAQVGF